MRTLNSVFRHVFVCQKGRVSDLNYSQKQASEGCIEATKRNMEKRKHVDIERLSDTYRLPKTVKQGKTGRLSVCVCAGVCWM